MSFVSVHIIAKENTNYGRLMFQASLESLVVDNKGYADEIVLYDDRCDKETKKMYMNMFIDHDVKSYTFPNVSNYCFTFADKRNACLLSTNKEATHIHWIDSDDIYYPNTLMTIKGLLENDTTHEVFVSHFLHIMGCPWIMESTYQKDNIFKYNTNMKWGGNVHEKLLGVNTHSQIKIPLPYYHAGYTRSAIATAIKWIHYAVLSGDENHYFNTNEPIYKEGLDKVIEDRFKDCSTLSGNMIPDAFKRVILSRYGCEETYGMWQDFVLSLDPQYLYFQKKFEEMAKKDGNWGAAIKEVIASELWKTM